MNVSLVRKPDCEVAVVIPVYKPTMTALEEIAFFQCIEILGHHPLILVAPTGLNVEAYQNAGKSISVIEFAPCYFADIAGYNRLMLSSMFYQKFLAFKYILIYQLDAFVFSDLLIHWCRLNYDYIGAPWVNVPEMDYWAANSSRIRQMWPSWARQLNNTVGNGGFSLRKVRSFILGLSLFDKKAKSWIENEDIFWSFFVPDYLPFFKVPECEVALKFAFEQHPSTCYELNRHDLPFGCHGWAKYEPEFWRPVFKEAGYET